MAVTRLIPFLRKNLFLTLALVGVLGLAGYFAIGAVHHARSWQTEPPVAVKPWMTNRYIAHTWHLPKEVMDRDLNLPRSRGGPMTLKAVAAERGVPVDDLIADVEAAILAHQARRE